MFSEQVVGTFRDLVIEALCVDARIRGQLDIDPAMITEFSRGSSSRRGPLESKPDPIKGSSTRSSGSSSCPLSSNAFELSRISRAIKSLPGYQRSLAIYAYADSCKWECIEIVSRHVWHIFLAAQSDVLRERKLQVLKGMVYLVMQNWKSLLNTGIELYSPKRVRELLRLSPHHWVRDWLPYWKQIHELLSDLDEKMLSDVYQGSRKAFDGKQLVAA